MAVGLALASPEKAFAWNSKFVAPLHEDITQAAYAAVLQRRIGDRGAFALDPATLLNPYHKSYPELSCEAQDYFLENLRYLRVGSYWNDFSTDNAIMYFISYEANCFIPKWDGATCPDYQTAFDVSHHMKQAHDLYGNTFCTLIQFNSRDRLDFIHSMLSTNADASDFYGQRKTKEFAMQWLQSAYAYAMGSGDPPDEPSCWSIIDPNCQCRPSLSDRLNTDSEAGEYDTGLGGLTTRQFRLRTLGMICHTIADSWCPGHACRAYHENEGENPDGSLNGTVPFGTILAFENYSMQTDGAIFFGTDNHAPYDVYSAADSDRCEGDIRADLNAGTATLQNALVYENESFGSVQSTLQHFNTLGLRETAQSMTDFLDLAFQGKGWDDDPFSYEAGRDDPFSSANPNARSYDGVGDWFDRVILPTFFTDDGDAWICDGGRRTIMIEKKLTPLLDSVRPALSDAFGDAALACCDVLDRAFSSFAAYQVEARAFFGTENATGSHFMPDSKETDCQATLKNALAQLHELICKTTDARQSCCQNLSSSQREDLATLVRRLGGVVQEFAIDLQGTPDKEETALYVHELTEALLA